MLINIQRSAPATLAATLAVVLLAGGARPAAAQTFDLVIADGRVMDPESKLDAIRNVGIRDGKIVAISEAPLAGNKRIDAKGLVVAPGFIDLHSHAVISLPGARMQVMDGVTTALELESGVIPVAGTYDLLAAEGRPLNYGFAVAWTFARASMVMGIPYEKFSANDWAGAYARTDWHGYFPPEKSREVLNLVERGLREGALGVGANMGYMPEVNFDETKQIAELTLKYGGVRTFFHIRHNEPFGPNNNLGGHEEVIAVAAMTGARMHFCHLNSNATRRIPEMIAAVTRARSYGLDISWEAYPYGAASTMASAAYLAPDNLGNLGIKPDAIVYMKTGEHMADGERLAQVQKEDPAGMVVVHMLDLDKAEDRALLDQAVTHPDSAIASDATFWQVGADILQGDIWPLPDITAGHPRAAGTFARVLGSYVRDGKLSLMDAIRKESLLPAQILETSVPQMKDKGRIRAGADADIVIFDPATVTDRATYDKPAQTSVGFHHVIVNGVPVVSNGELVRTAMPGRAVRRPVTD